MKVDLFHAVQRVVSKIPKRGSKGSVIKELRRRLKEDLKLVFRDPSDLGTIRTKSTLQKKYYWKILSISLQSGTALRATVKQF